MMSIDFWSFVDFERSLGTVNAYVYLSTTQSLLLRNRDRSDVLPGRILFAYRLVFVVGSELYFRWRNVCRLVGTRNLPSLQNYAI